MGVKLVAGSAERKGAGGSLLIIARVLLAIVVLPLIGLAALFYTLALYTILSGTPEPEKGHQWVVWMGHVFAAPTILLTSILYGLFPAAPGGPILLARWRTARQVIALALGALAFLGLLALLY